MSRKQKKDNFVDAKVRKYEEFLNEKLQNDLHGVHKERDKLYAQIAEYMQLKRTIEIVKENKKETESNKHKMKTQMDLGCNFYCQALITDTNYVCVLVGYGYYVQMTLDEACVFVDKRILLLKNKSEYLTRQSGKIKAHIRLVMEELRELQSLNFSTET